MEDLFARILRGYSRHPKYSTLRYKAGEACEATAAVTPSAKHTVLRVGAMGAAVPRSVSAARYRVQQMYNGETATGYRHYSPTGFS